MSESLLWRLLCAPIVERLTIPPPTGNPEPFVKPAPTHPADADVVETAADERKSDG